MAEQYTILGGKVHVYKRPNSGCWQCSGYFAGKNRRTSTRKIFDSTVTAAHGRRTACGTRISACA